MTNFYELKLNEIRLAHTVTEIDRIKILALFSENKDFLLAAKNALIIPVFDQTANSYGFIFLYSLLLYDAYFTTDDRFCVYGLSPENTDKVKAIYPSHFDQLNPDSTTLLKANDSPVKELVHKLDCDDSIKATLIPALRCFNTFITIDPKLATIHKQISLGHHPLEAISAQVNKAMQQQDVTTRLWLAIHFCWEVTYVAKVIKFLPNLQHLTIFVVEKLARYHGANKDYLELLHNVAALNHLTSFAFLYGYADKGNPDFFASLLANNNKSPLMTILQKPSLRKLTLSGDITEQNLFNLLKVVAAKSNINALIVWSIKKTPCSEQLLDTITAFLSENNSLFDFELPINLSIDQLNTIIPALDNNRKITAIDFGRNRLDNTMLKEFDDKITAICERNAANKIQQTWRFFWNTSRNQQKLTIDKKPSNITLEHN